MRSIPACLASLLLVADASAYPGSPPLGRAGEPPDGRTCAGCHDSFALNSGDVTLALTEAPGGAPLTRYEPGLAYDLLFEVRSGEAGRGRWGFELIPLSSEAMAGELSAGPSSSLQPDGARTYLSHSPAISDPDVGSWPFSWTAPPSDVGDILFWACGNAANGDGRERGDYIECTSFLLSPGTAEGGAVTRVVRWQGEAVAAAVEAFAAEGCSVPSADLALCQETGLSQETIAESLPTSIAGEGRLVFIEHDSDTAAAGTDDVIEVRKDPAVPGGLSVSRR